MERFEKIFIHEESWDSKVAVRLRSLFSDTQIQRVSQRPFPERDGTLSAHDFSASKRLLYVAPHLGQFFKRCPGSRPGLMCCSYFVLNLGLQCDMNCSYCYLQSFINTPLLTIYSNLGQALGELKELANDLGNQKVRLGTGEVIDSLSLDDLTLYSRELIAAFREFPNWTLEFKTKSAKVEQFLDVPHRGNVIVSWSVNPEQVIAREEHGTASLNERLAAAEKAKAAGFQVAFHIDPMIWHEDWRANYTQLVDAITTRFNPHEVPYLSAGALRFQPSQRHLMRERFGMKSWVTSAEVFPSRDGKLRYDKMVRQEMFDFLVQEFRQRDPQWRIFLCMESPDTWLKTMDQLPLSDPSLEPLFDRQVLAKYREQRLS